MEQDELISINEFCIHYNVESSFINSLQEYGLIEIINTENVLFISKDKLPELEKFTRFYYEMDINIEGIEAIANLLQRIHQLQHEINDLKNKVD